MIILKTPFVSIDYKPRNDPDKLKIFDTITTIKTFNFVSPEIPNDKLLNKLIKSRDKYCSCPYITSKGRFPSPAINNNYNRLSVFLRNDNDSRKIVKVKRFQNRRESELAKNSNILENSFDEFIGDHLDRSLNKNSISRSKSPMAFKLRCSYDTKKLNPIKIKSKNLRYDSFLSPTKIRINKKKSVTPKILDYFNHVKNS